MATGNRVPGCGVGDFGQAILQRMAESGGAHRQHAWWRPERLELEALTEKVKRLVALGGPELGIGAFGEDSLDRDAGMELEVLAHLARPVRKIPAALERHGRRHAACGEHDHLRANLETMALVSRERRHHLPHDRAGTLSLAHHLLYLHAGQHPRAGAQGRRYIGDVHTL